MDLTNPEAWMTEETLNEKLEVEWKNIEQAKADVEKYNMELQALLDTNNTNISEGFRQYEHVARQYKIYTANLDKAVKRAKLAWLSEVDDELIEERNYQLTEIKVGTTFELKNIVFDFGKARISRDGRKVLAKVGEAMAGTQDMQIRVIGHTDNVPIRRAYRAKFPSNWELSVTRAAAVARYLQHKSKIDPGRLEAVGRSFYAPLASNDTKEGRAQNRRVEIILTPASD